MSKRFSRASLCAVAFHIVFLKAGISVRRQDNTTIQFVNQNGQFFINAAQCLDEAGSACCSDFCAYQDFDLATELRLLQQCDSKTVVLIRKGSSAAIQSQINASNLKGFKVTPFVLGTVKLIVNVGEAMNSLFLQREA